MSTGETVYFNEDLKGDRMLVTSRIIAFKGVHFDTTVVDGLSECSYRHSTNGIPDRATYIVAVSCGNKSISIDCAGWFWFGQKRYQQLRAALWPAVGSRLVTQAMQQLVKGDQLTFHNGGGSKNVQRSP
jgi:hypothetical protein